jgi:hypothetical protein
MKIVRWNGHLRNGDKIIIKLTVIVVWTVTLLIILKPIINP